MPDNSVNIEKSASQLYATTGDMYKMDCIFLAALPELNDPDEVIKNISLVAEAFNWIQNEEETSSHIRYEIEKINNFPANIESVFIKILKREQLNRG